MADHNTPKIRRNFLIVQLRDEEGFTFRQIAKSFKYELSVQAIQQTYHRWKDRYYANK